MLHHVSGEPFNAYELITYLKSAVIDGVDDVEDAIKTIIGIR